MSSARKLLTRVCTLCNKPFETHAGNARSCPECRPDAEKRRFQRWYEANRERHIANTTARKKTEGRKRQEGSWDAPAPEYRSRYLPGGACELLTIPRWRLDHRHLVPLHGLVTALTGAHDPRVPRFCLIPTDSEFGWGVYLAEDVLAARFAGRTHRGKLSGNPVQLAAGPLIRLKAPCRPEPGRHRVTIEALTPVLVRANATSSHTAPTTGNLHSTVTAWLPRRVGIEDCGLVRLNMIESDTRPYHVSMSGKLNGPKGWVGAVTVDVNAPGLWLLRVAERIGFGGRCAFGFGRIRVTVC